MSAGTQDADERFAALAERFAGRPDVSLPEEGPRRFGALTLRVGRSIFAMLQDGDLVLKLPRDRVTGLVAEGAGAPFGNAGRVMKEWVRVGSTDPATWLALAEEAYTFVGASSS